MKLFNFSACEKALKARQPELTLESLARDYISECRIRTKRSTCSTYSIVLSRHILPRFGERDIESISREEISSFLYAKAYPEEGEGLSAGSMRLLVCVLRALFRFAETRGLKTLPWSSIRCPALKSSDSRVLSEDQQQRLKLYLCSDTDSKKLGVLICLYTGLRIGEICAMRWEDVDFDHATINVRRTIQRIRNLDAGTAEGESRTKVIFDAPKSRSGQRSIPLPGFLLDIMRQCRRDKDCFILSGSAENYTEPRTFQNNYRRIMKEAGVEYINFHSLRHTFATNCVNLGFDAKTLSEILGHSSVSVTLNTYVHPSHSLMRTYMERLS